MRLLSSPSCSRVEMRRSWCQPCEPPSHSGPRVAGGFGDTWPIACLLCLQNDTDSNVSEQQTFLVVVAVDFGTTSSGYAYSFAKEPECIHVMRRVLRAGRGPSWCQPPHLGGLGRALGGRGIG